MLDHPVVEGFGGVKELFRAPLAGVGCVQERQHLMVRKVRSALSIDDRVVGLDDRLEPQVQNGRQVFLLEDVIDRDRECSRWVVVIGGPAEEMRCLRVEWIDETPLARGRHLEG